jgi:methylated-DNA-[protein]-cysteine S-methyltransferase
MLHTDTYLSPLGLIVLESDGKVLTGLRFVENSDTPQQTGETISEDTTDTLPIFAEVRQWLDDYFAGKRPCNVPRLNPPGTDFQRRVWQRLFTIFYGQTKTYGEIAKMVGCKSARAVGQAIGRNPIALIIPCHRVVGANGTLGGYAYGVDRKKQLLELEK